MADYTYTIFLDAGHGGSDPGAVYNGRREKDDTLALTLAIGDILESYGFNVKYARTEDIYESPYQKAAEGNASGSDIFISIHRNSSPYPNQYSGVESLVYNAWLPAGTIATNINRQLEEVGYKNLGVNERPNLVVLRQSNSPAGLVEVGFINIALDSALLDQKFDGTARAVGDGLAGPRWTWLVSSSAHAASRSVWLGTRRNKLRLYLPPHSGRRDSRKTRSLFFLHKQRNNRYGDYT